ncbi:DUF1460 domain-containing protein [Bacteroidales bacterium OttesenSCG-928-M11]|nr:DUF1460 domain-containing protein [Bacteroidales bacterium OttesenSCG-928-M11]
MFIRFIICLFLFPLAASCQTSIDQEILNQYFQDSEECNCSPIIKTALYFVNTPYVAGTLEKNEGKEEKLIINLREMDCTTFVEYCLAISQIESAHENPTYELFSKQLQKIRYRNGIIEDYSSRLHYISDWLINNEEMGLIINETNLISDKLLHINVNYMSSHPQYYPALKSNPGLIAKIKKQEEAINQALSSYFFIPKEDINQKSTEINSGDIVFFTTAIQGLDVQHAGIAYHHNGIVGFIHASSKAGNVIIEPVSIADYCAKQKNITGILIATPVY